MRLARGRLLSAAVAGAALLALSGCATGSLATSDTTRPPSSTSASATSPTGPTVLVTVPDLLISSAAAAPAAPSPSAAPPSAAPPSAEAPGAAAQSEEPAIGDTGADPPAPDTADAVPEQPAEAAAPAPVPTPAPAPEAEAPPGEGLNVSLANCDGCTVLATHRGVTGDLAAALVATGSGRAVLLSVAGDGQVSGVIGVPYGAAFGAPAGGVLACAQGRCVVEGRQSDGRAILSAFELTGSGAWRDVSGNDAFPSATEQGTVVDIDGDLAIAVQDQADGAAVWMLYTWDGGQYSVIGCAPDGPAPASAGAVSPGTCLS